ncbi:23740_t:CDS:1, partial [Gigaspora margarita]
MANIAEIVFKKFEEKEILAEEEEDNIEMLNSAKDLGSNETFIDLTL